MTLRTLMLLAAIAMATLVAGCDGSRQEDGSSPQRQSEAANINSPGSCAGRGSANLQQQGSGVVSNGKIAFERLPVGSPPPYEDIYVIDEDGTNETRLTNHPGGEDSPVWSPDGQRIAFASQRDRPIDIYVMDADGTNEKPLANEKATRYGPVWSPDGEQIAFLRSPTEGPGVADDVYVIDEDGTNETRLTQTHSDPETRTTLGFLVWSPDGNKIAFSSSTITTTLPSSDSPETAGASPAPAAGMSGIYVIDVATAGLCKLTSTGVSPTWSPDGNKIAFYDKDAINMINSDGRGRKELANTEPAQPAASWSPEGERIAFLKQSDLYVINANGTGLIRLADTLDITGSEAFPAWSHAWSPDGEKVAFPCPAAPGGEGNDLCVINADGSEWKRIALRVAPESFLGAVSWGRG